eukprot:2815458-Heterocapsa_arctica.AAC.1
MAIPKSRRAILGRFHRGSFPPVPHLFPSPGHHSPVRPVLQHVAVLVLVVLGVQEHVPEHIVRHLIFPHVPEPVEEQRVRHPSEAAVFDYTEQVLLVLCGPT